MAFVTFLQSMPGRVLRVVGGALLLWAGARNASMAGLLLMMIALIPMVTAIANVCLVADAHDLIVGARHSPPADRPGTMTRGGSHVRTH